MKISENWLRSWVNPAASTRELADRLLMAGLELEIEPAVAELPTGVVVGRIEKIVPHPQADKLRVCEVSVGQKQSLSIVCGAANAREGMRVPTALIGARLSGGLEIKPAKLRGVDSAGMLCSAKELGLGEKSEGLLELDADARIGAPLIEHLGLDDRILNLELTPNRGDCLSVAGLAREVSALFNTPVSAPEARPATVMIDRRYAVEIEDLKDCPSYAGRVVTGINADARTPDWMRERLRRAGIRCLHPVVDITNYVMLELGQPMHAFDCARLTGAVRVRKARAGERLVLLNEQTVDLSAADLLIADDQGALALAGVMGGAASGVTGPTTDVFLESACFAPQAVAGTGRRHKLQSDAVYRFERGVDPDLQRAALERAAALIQEICGGRAGPVTHTGRVRSEPVRITLRLVRLQQLLGHAIAMDEVAALLSRLGIVIEKKTGDTWTARIPSYRYDLRIEPDLIEEVARLYGYDRIPAKPYRTQLAPAPRPEGEKELDRVRQALVARGYQEAVTYSFVDPKLQSHLTPGIDAIPLDNPIAETMSVMRTTLLSGLIPAWLYNQQRQQRRVRLFEIGVCFTQSDGRVVEVSRLGGLVAGSALPEQWGAPQRTVDFYDVKADVEALLGGAEYRFERAQHEALHPGQTARIMRNGQPAGWLGAVHPRVVRALDLPETPYVFELDWPALAPVRLPSYASVSEFPSSRRDLALVLKEEISADALLDCARQAGGPALQRVFVFDVYRGQGLPNGCKSIALGLIFQGNSRTLTDEEVDASVQAVANRLTQEVGASIRG